MDELYHATIYNGDNYLSILGLMIIHVSIREPRALNIVALFTSWFNITPDPWYSWPVATYLRCSNLLRIRGENVRGSWLRALSTKEPCLGASYQIRKIAGCACAGNAGNVSPRRRLQKKPLVSDPGMHHGTCAVMHVGIAYPRWRGKRSRHSRRMRTRNFPYLARDPWAQSWLAWVTQTTGPFSNTN